MKELSDSVIIKTRHKCASVLIFLSLLGFSFSSANAAQVTLSGPWTGDSDFADVLIGQSITFKAKAQRSILFTFSTYCKTYKWYILSMDRKIISYRETGDISSVTMNVPSTANQSYFVRVEALECGGKINDFASDEKYINVRVGIPIISGGEFCPGQSTLFTVTPQGPTTSYKWYLPQGFTINGKNRYTSSETSVYITPPASAPTGYYEITVYAEYQGEPSPYGNLVEAWYEPITFPEIFLLRSRRSNQDPRMAELDLVAEPNTSGPYNYIWYLNNERIHHGSEGTVQHGLVAGLCGETVSIQIEIRRCGNLYKSPPKIFNLTCDHFRLSDIEEVEPLNISEIIPTSNGNIYEAKGMPAGSNVVVYNTLGQIVLETSLKDGLIDLGNYERGVYMICVYDNKNIARKKVIKN